MGGTPANGTQLEELFYATSTDGITSDLPELAGFTNETDWTVPYCTLNLIGHNITFSLTAAYDEAVGGCPSEGHGSCPCCCCGHGFMPVLFTSECFMLCCSGHFNGILQSSWGSVGTDSRRASQRHAH